MLPSASEVDDKAEGPTSYIRSGALLSLYRKVVFMRHLVVQFRAKGCCLIVFLVVSFVLICVQLFRIVVVTIAASVSQCLNF